MASEIAAQDIFTVNPYEGHPSLSQLEAEVLWEYAKLAQHIRSVRYFSALSSSNSPNGIECPAIPEDKRLE